MTIGIDFVTQRHQRTAEQLRFKNLHAEKLLRMQIGDNGEFEVQKQYELKMFKKKQLKVQRDLDILRSRAAKLIRWSELMVGDPTPDEPDVESKVEKTDECKNNLEKTCKRKIRIKNKRLAKNHHKCTKDFVRAQEESDNFIESLQGKDKCEILQELDEFFRPKTARTEMTIQMKRQREKDLLDDSRKNSYNNSHSKPRYKDVNLAELDIAAIRDKISHRIQQEKTRESEDRLESRVVTPLLGNGHYTPRLAVDVSKLSKPKAKRKKSIDQVDFANSEYATQRLKKEKSLLKSNESQQLPVLRKLSILPDIEISETVDKLEDLQGDWLSKPATVDSESSDCYNADGSFRTVYTLPNAHIAFSEAKKARYLRKKNARIDDNNLDFDAIFSRKEDVIVEEHEGDDNESENNYCLRTSN